MADDSLFGDVALFEEFDKERESTGAFIIYENDGDNCASGSRFVFQESSDSSSDESTDDERKVKVQEQSVTASLESLKKQSGYTNGQRSSSDGETSDEDGPSNVITKDRQDKASQFKLNYERILLLYFKKMKHFFLSLSLLVIVCELVYKLKPESSKRPVSRLELYAR